MAKFGNANKVRIADMDLKIARASADRVNRLCGRQVAGATAVNVTHPAEIEVFLKGLDACLSSVPYYYNFEIAKAAIRARVSMCDLGGNTQIVMKEQLLDREATAAGISIVPDCGECPGLRITIACYAMSLLARRGKVFFIQLGLPGACTTQISLRR
jgi:lysine 6-dehydrogenase